MIGWTSAATRRSATLLAILLTLTAAAPAAPTLESAVRALLAASSLPIAPESTCHGIIPGVPRPTLGDMVAIPLAALDGGTNRVAGGCAGDQCRIRITHRAGEDVFSYQYRFKLAQGRLVPASLECFWTP